MYTCVTCSVLKVSKGVIYQVWSLNFEKKKKKRGGGAESLWILERTVCRIRNPVIRL